MAVSSSSLESDALAGIFEVRLSPIQPLLNIPAISDIQIPHSAERTGKRWVARHLELGQYGSPDVEPEELVEKDCSSD